MHVINMSNTVVYYTNCLLAGVYLVIQLSNLYQSHHIAFEVCSTHVLAN